MVWRGQLSRRTAPGSPRTLHPAAGELMHAGAGVRRFLALGAAQKGWSGLEGCKRRWSLPLPALTAASMHTVSNQAKI